MIRKTIILLSMALMPASEMLAGPVSAGQARQKAMQFLQQQVTIGTRRQAPSTRQLRLVATGAADSYYLFCAPSGEGFVVVSGEDSAEPILGYSHTGTLNPDSLPCGMKVLLDSYEQQIASIREHSLASDAQAPRHASAGDYILPASRLTTYDQYDPYNLLCPEKDGVHCLTGCVATAMAGLMYYHQWPKATTTAIPSYLTDTLKLSVSGVPAGTPINWERIKQHYTPGNTKEEGRGDIATLMKMAGASVRMNYFPSSGGAFGYTIPYALKQYFCYEMAIFEQSSYYAATEWAEKIRREIAQNGPVIYGGLRIKEIKENGDTVFGGHAFLLEGYDAEGKFNVNFGWNGDGNDVFRLTVADAPFLYIYHQSAIFGVRPRDPLDNVPVSLRLWTDLLQPRSDVVYQRSSATSDFEGIDLDYTLINYMPVSHAWSTQSENKFDFGVTFKRHDRGQYEPSKTLFQDIMFPLNDGILSEPADAFAYGSGLSDGQYDVFLVSRETGKEEWCLNDNSQHEFAKAWICGNNMTFKSPRAHAAQLSVSDVKPNNDNDLTVGQETTFNCKISNLIAPALYDGAILVKLVWHDDYGQQQDKVVAIDEMHLKGVESRQLSFSLTPPASGNMELQFLDRCWKVIHTHNLKVNDAGNVSDDPEDPNAPALTDHIIKYWFDSEQELAGTLTNINGALQIDVSALSDGLHTLHLAVGAIGSENEYFEEASRAVYFEKRGEETQVRNRFYVDNVETTVLRYDAGNSYTLALPVEKVGEGLHSLTSVIETTQGERPVIVSDYFQRVATAEELGNMRLSVSIDDVAPTMLQRPFTADSLVYDLDVSKMQPGLHDLTYQVTGLVQTAPQKAFFVIDPTITGIDYWLNGDLETLDHFAVNTFGSAAAESEVFLPVRRMPLRTSNFSFNIESGDAVTYAINDIDLQLATVYGSTGDYAAKYIDTPSRTTVNATLLQRNNPVTKAAPATGRLEWYCLKADKGDNIGLKASRPCVMQLYSPNADIVYKATGSNAVNIGETQVQQSGTYYLAIHDMADDLGQADITVSYYNSSEEPATVRGDVNGDGNVDVADIGSIISIMAGESALANSSGDVNGDGVVDVADIGEVISIMAALARLASAFS